MEIKGTVVADFNALHRNETVNTIILFIPSKCIDKKKASVITFRFLIKSNNINNKKDGNST